MVMSEKIEVPGETRKNKVTGIDRRSYIKSLATVGSGLALTGAGVTTYGTENVQAAPSTIEDFDRSNPLADYSGNTDLYTITTSSSEVIQGSKTLKSTNEYPSIGSDTTSTPRGYEYRTRIKMGNSAAEPALLVCIQDTSRPAKQCYQAHVDRSAGSLRLALKDSSASSTYTKLASTSLPSLSTDTEYELAVELGSESLKAILYDSSGSSVLAETGQVSDTTWSGGQLGFYTGGAGGYPAYYDSVTKEPIGTGGSDPIYVSVDDFSPHSELSSHYRFNTGSNNAKIVRDDEAAYSGNNQLGPSYHGEGTLEHTGGSVEMLSLEGDGLLNYPQPGDSFSTWVLSEGGVGDTYLVYGAESVEDYYALNVDFTNGRITLFKRNSGTWSSINGQNVSVDPDTWYYLEVDWGTSGTHDIYLYDIHENVVGEFTATDTDFTAKGIGFISHPGDSSEKFYWDHFIIGESTLNKGGWGTEVLRAAGPYPRDNASDPVEDFQFFFDYEGYDEDNTNHIFNIGGFSHTYYDDSGNTSIDKNELFYWGNIQRANLSVEVLHPDGSSLSQAEIDEFSGDNNVLLDRIPSGQFVTWAGESKWKNLIENHWNESVEDRTRISNEMRDAGVLDKNEDNPSLVDVGVLALGIITLPISGGAGTALSVASSGFSAFRMVRDYTTDSDGGLDFDDSVDQSSGYYDFTSPYPAIINYSNRFRLDVSSVPSNQDLLIRVKQDFVRDSTIYSDIATSAITEVAVEDGQAAGPFEVRSRLLRE